MAVCIECGKEFDVAAVRRKLSREYYKGVYDDQYPDANVCYDCALPDISASWGGGGRRRPNQRHGLRLGP